MLIMIGGSCFAAAAPLIGEDLPVAFATGSLPPRDELPLINVQAALNLDYDSGGLEPHQVQKPGKSAPGGCGSFNLVQVFSFRRPLPSEEREAFDVSRGFPFLKVAATFRCNDLILFTCRYNGRRRIISIR